MDHPDLEELLSPEPEGNGEVGEAQDRITTLTAARVGLAKAELLNRAVIAQVRRSVEVYQLAGRELDALAAELILGSLEQIDRDLEKLQRRTGQVRRGETDR